MYLVAVKVGIPRCIGDEGGVDPGYGLGHAVRYLLFRGRLVQGEQGGDALRHGLGGDDDYALFGQRDALLRGHDDVLVVGQDENGLCGRAVYLGEYVLGGGVHGLAAGDYPVRAQLPEELGHARAGADGDGAEGLLGGGYPRFSRGGLASGHLAVLLAHVFDLHLEQRAVGKRFGQDRAGDVRMDVDFYDLVVVHDDDAVAQGLKEAAQQGGLLAVLTSADELRAVGEGYLTRGEVGEIGPLLRLGLVFRRGLGGDEGLAAQDGERRLQDEDIALAARVHDAGTGENGVEVYRVSQSLDGGLHGAGEHELKVGAVLGELDGGARGHAGDGEDGALGGLHDSLVGGVHSVAHRGGIELGVGLLSALEPLGEAAEEQGEYDAGVASRAAEHGRGRAVRRGAEGGKALLRELRRRGAHGEAHVGAGISVRHGEDVQLVDELPVLFEGGVGAEDDILEHRRINKFSQEGQPPGLIFVSVSR